MVWERFQPVTAKKRRPPRRIASARSGHAEREVMHLLKTFLIGAIGYPALELLWRRRTHPSMALAGGMAMLLIRRVSRLQAGLLPRSLLCGAGITAIEYVVGRAWNRTYRIWDYRRQPLNLHGQICLPYAAAWCGLSAIVLTVMDASRKERPDS